MVKAALLLGVGAGSSIAQAQFEPRISGKPGEEHVMSGFGVSVQGGGGVTAFMGSNENSLTDIGGSWDVRAVLGTRTIPAFEAAYVGSARAINGGTLNGDGLVGNGLEANFRLNAPFLEKQTLIEPFAFVGLGWSRYNLTGIAGNQVVVSRWNDVGVVPMGAGLAVAYRGFLAEARFTYRPAFGDDDLVLSSDGSRFGLDTWNAGLMVGFEF
jgi:hypothetical protein